MGGYTRLREAVKKTLLLAQQRIEREKVLSYWRTGDLINRHLRRAYPGKKDAEYGRQVVLRLSRDLEIGEKVLYRTMRFAESFPNFSARRNLRWTHYRELIAVSDDKQRFELARRAEEGDWTTGRLIEKIKTEAREEDGKSKGRTFPPGDRALLQPRKGVPYTYRLARPEKIHPGKAGLKIDLGFSSRKDAAMKGAEGLRAGEIVVSEWVEGDTYRLKRASGKIEADLFTYYAFIERAVDGDTVIAEVDLGFGCSTRQYLRLRGIDAPELDTPAGKRAKKFVESELAGVPYVTISSTRSDKYDRYLADIFYSSGSGEKFLTNELLKAALAVRI